MEVRETVVVTVLQQVVALPIVLLVVFQNGYGTRDRGFGGGFDSPRFPRGGVRQSRGRRDGGYVLSGFANPSVEQMAQHWFASHFANPSVETFAHPLSQY